MGDIKFKIKDASDKINIPDFIKKTLDTSECYKSDIDTFYFCYDYLIKNEIPNRIADIEKRGSNLDGGVTILKNYRTMLGDLSLDIKFSNSIQYGNDLNVHLANEVIYKLDLQLIEDGRYMASDHKHWFLKDIYLIETIRSMDKRIIEIETIEKQKSDVISDIINSKAKTNNISPTSKTIVLYYHYLWESGLKGITTENVVDIAKKYDRSEKDLLNKRNKLVKDKEAFLNIGTSKISATSNIKNLKATIKMLARTNYPLAVKSAKEDLVKVEIAFNKLK